MPEVPGPDSRRPGLALWRQDLALAPEDVDVHRGHPPVPAVLLASLVDREVALVARGRDEEPAIADCRLGIGVAARRAGQSGRAAQALRRARRWYEGAAQPGPVARVDVAAARLATSDGRLDEASVRAASGAIALGEFGEPAEHAAALFTWGVIDQLRLADREAAAAFGAAAARFATAGLPLAVAACHQQLAVLERDRAPDRAWDHALLAVGLLDQHRYRLRTPAGRAAWVAFATHTLGLALDLAATGHDHAAVAELLEAARNQAAPAAAADGGASASVLPDEFAVPARPTGAGPVPAAHDEAHPEAAALAGDLPTAPMRHVAVGGSSRIAERLARFWATTDGHVDEGLGPVAVESTRDDVGGAGSCWWGTWVVGERLWWSFLVGAEPPTSGWVDIGPGTAGGEAVSLARGATPAPLPAEDPGTTARRVWDGGLLGPPEATARLGGELGRLLPPPLHDRLRRAAPGEPVRVVAALHPRLAGLPLALAAVDRAGAPPDGEHADGLCLVERADLLVAPTAAFLSARQDRGLPAGRAPAAGATSVELHDPLGDLPFARTRSTRGHLTDGGPTGDRPAGGGHGHDVVLVGADATRPALEAALGRPGARRAGLLAFLGHAEASSLADAHLCLARAPAHVGAPCPHRRGCPGSPLTAAELLRAPADAPALGTDLPPRALLAACRSAGAELAGDGGEWLGLAPALLWAGAEVVVATAWPILDHPVTAAVDADLKARLLSSADPAAGVASLQRRWLDRWRRTGRSTSTELLGGTGSVPADHAAPVFWAGLVVTGWSPAPR